MFLIEQKRTGWLRRRKGQHSAELCRCAPRSFSLVPYVIDRNPAKQLKFLPGSRIPIVDESRLLDDRPDWVLILAWNLRDEILSQLAFIREWNGRFVQAVPILSVF